MARKKKARARAKVSARRSKKTARRSARSTRKAAPRRRAAPRKSKRKARVMHCPAVIAADGTATLVPQQYDSLGNEIKLPEGSKRCGKTKTSGPRYNYLCADHKSLSPAAKKQGLLDKPAEPAPTTGEVVASAGVVVQTPPVALPSPDPETAAADAAAVSAAEAAEAAETTEAETPAPALNGGGEHAEKAEEAVAQSATAAPTGTEN